VAVTEKKSNFLGGRRRRRRRRRRKRRRKVGFTGRTMWMSLVCCISSITDTLF